MKTVEGTLENIVFFNEDNGFVIGIVDTQEGNIYIKGYIPFVNEGEKYRFEGMWKNHPTYGEQFEVSGCEIIKPETVDDIEAYLASGIIKGIGKKTARLIVEKFGADAFDVMENSPEKLLNIEGIGKKKLETIVDSYKREMELKSIMMFLQNLGLSVTIATKVYKVTGKDTIEAVKRNPYILAEKIDRIGFKTADAAAVKLGTSPESPFRINSAVRHIIGKVTNFGDTFIFLDELVEETKDLITVETDNIENEINEMVIRGEIIADFEIDESNPAIYPQFFHHAEWSSAKKLLEIQLHADSEMAMKTGIVEEIEERMGVRLHEQQKKAVNSTAKNGVCVITGGPGTGKTTIINVLIDVFEACAKKVLLAAPTGRAAKRMTEATGHDAKTIHRLLEYQMSEDDRNLRFLRDADNPLDGDVLIVDEFSMVDIALFYYLLNAVRPGMRLILVGDVDQLPSVGPGTVLRDIIDSKLIAVSRLTQIFRQGLESMIVQNAHRVNSGRMPILNSKDKDFFFIATSDQREAVAKVEELCRERLPAYYDVDGLRDIHVLSVTKSGILGTNNLNEILQNSLNPRKDKDDGYDMRNGGVNEKVIGDRLFRVGDKVMQIKNNYNKVCKDKSGSDSIGVFNGDIGYITGIDDSIKRLSIEFDDEKYANYEYGELDEIISAYAMTVHKSQGSEYPIVVMPLASTVPFLMNRNILYTAITRAKRLVVLVGSEATLARMVNNSSDQKRKSGLFRRLKSFEKVLGGSEGNNEAVGETS